MSALKHIVVVSHPRSGTHLTMDAIGNNADLYSDVYRSMGIIEIDRLVQHHKGDDRKYLEQVIQDAETFTNGPRIIKTHTHSSIHSFFGACNQSTYAGIQNIFRDLSTIIYVRRNPLDVLWSLYHYHARISERVQKVSFSDYIREKDDFVDGSIPTGLDRVEHLKMHVQGWMSVSNVAVIKYEDWIHDYDQTLLRVLRLCGCNPLSTTTQDVRMGQEHFFEYFLNMMSKNRWIGYVADRLRWRMFPDVDRTSVYFRHGRVGEGIKNCSSADARFVKKRMGDFFYE